MGRMLRGVVVAVAAFMLAVPAAQAQDTASTALNILPSGQFQTTGNPIATRQAEMYNALTPLRANVSDGDLTKYFKSEALDPGRIVRTETIPERPGVQIRRDEYDVPHIYGQTDDDSSRASTSSSPPSRRTTSSLGRRRRSKRRARRASSCCTTSTPSSPESTPGIR